MKVAVFFSSLLVFISVNTQAQPVSAPTDPIQVLKANIGSNWSGGYSQSAPFSEDEWLNACRFTEYEYNPTSSTPNYTLSFRLDYSHVNCDQDCNSFPENRYPWNAVSYPPPAWPPAPNEKLEVDQAHSAMIYTPSSYGEPVSGRIIFHYDPTTLHILAWSSCGDVNGLNTCFKDVNPGNVPTDLDYAAKIVGIRQSICSPVTSSN